MIQKTNLKDSVNKIEELFSYKRVGTLNKDNTGGTFETDTQADVQLLLNNLDNIHTTEMGAERIRKNLKLQETDVVAYCKEIISDSACRIYKQGKNWYCEIDNIVLTINSYSYTIITAHKKK